MLVFRMLLFKNVRPIITLLDLWLGRGGCVFISNIISISDSYAASSLFKVMLIDSDNNVINTLSSYVQSMHIHKRCQITVEYRNNVVFST